MVFENEEIMSSKEAVSLAVFVYLAGSHHPLASSFQDSLLLSWLIRSFGLFRQSDACARQVHSSTAPKWVGSVRGPSRWRGERRQTGPCVACRRQCANSWRALHSRIATCTTHCLLRRVHRIVTLSPGVYLLFFFFKLFLEMFQILPIRSRTIHLASFSRFSLIIRARCSHQQLPIGFRLRCFFSSTSKSPPVSLSSSARSLPNHCCSSSRQLAVGDVITGTNLISTSDGFTFGLKRLLCGYFYLSNC